MTNLFAFWKYFPSFEDLERGSLKSFPIFFRDPREVEGLSSSDSVVSDPSDDSVVDARITKIEIKVIIVSLEKF